MNGRIYDPTLGRFLQADPHIQAPTNTQNYNRYSYVLNNPMSYTDPSGYFFVSMFKGVRKFVKKHWKTIAAIGIAFWNPGALLFNSTWAAGAATGFISGAVSTGSLRGAMVGAISGGMFGGLHSMEFGFDKVMMHGLAGGVSSVLGGGKFGHGFLSAGLTQGLSQRINGLSTKFSRVLASSVLGGTVSRLTGGKFANGAITAAFSRALNDEGKDGLEIEEDDGATTKADINKMLKLGISKDENLLAEIKSGSATITLDGDKLNVKIGKTIQSFSVSEQEVKGFGLSWGKASLVFSAQDQKIRFALNVSVTTNVQIPVASGTFNVRTWALNNSGLIGMGARHLNNRTKVIDKAVACGTGEATCTR